MFRSLWFHDKAARTHQIVMGQTWLIVYIFKVGESYGRLGIWLWRRHLSSARMTLNQHFAENFAVMVSSTEAGLKSSDLDF